MRSIRRPFLNLKIREVDAPMSRSSNKLKETIGELASRSRTTRQAVGVDISPGCAFGAVIEQRLKDMERNLADLKARLNGLIFLVVGAVLVEVIMRLVR